MGDLSPQEQVAAIETIVKNYVIPRVAELAAKTVADELMPEFSQMCEGIARDVATNVTRDILASVIGKEFSVSVQLIPKEPG